MINPPPHIDVNKSYKTAHFSKVMSDKGFSLHQVKSALSTPREITKVMSRPEFAYNAYQFRYCGYGVAVIVDVENTPILITIYEDRVRTPLREDQMDDPYALNSSRALR